MKILVLNIDRDDDFGRKAKVKSPIIGLENNLDAANKLGQVDPEDSDLNAIFSAIMTYKSLLKEGKNAEIATICGSINVGIRSDQILSEQLERVIKETEAKEVILITDGAEDEYIVPIVQSRIKISSIQRVSIKQSQELEDTYYRVIKLLDDEKVKKQFILPISLILIVGALSALFGMAASGFGAILFTLGIYLLIRTFSWERNIAAVWEEIKSGFLTGKLSFYTYLVSFVILAATLFYAWTLAQSDISEEILWVIPVLSFLKHVIWGIVVAGLLSSFGRFVDIYVREKRVQWSYWIIPFSLSAFGFISSAIFDSLYDSIQNDFSITPFLTFNFVSYISVGILIALIGAITYHYIKDTYISDKQELEIEEQTSQLLQEN
ncbi:MAG: hypothetical protein DRO67_06105 [Candidatus Asgardarchaeum californiense]|nr:MAG: hypothetical protein DRO67_06105 [Candidatus Asgardarchaeum californiense]